MEKQQSYMVRRVQRTKLAQITDKKMHEYNTRKDKPVYHPPFVQPTFADILWG